MCEADPLHGIVDCGDDSRRRVVRVESRSPRGGVFLTRKQHFEAFAFGFPVSRERRGKDLRNASPADILYENSLLFVVRGAALGIEQSNELNCSEVVAALLLK
jgi:hypothetical protein